MLDFVKAPIATHIRQADNILRIRHQPDGGGLGDCCFAADAAGVHCFYIWRDASLPADCHAPGNETAIGHSVGTEIGTLAKVTDAFRLSDGCHAWAPSVVRHNGRWMMFYTHVTAALYQTIRMAVSDDLYNWTMSEEDGIDCIRFPWARSQAGGYTSCRDPYVTCFGGVWHCYYTVQLVNGNAGMGVAVSDDLHIWRDVGSCMERPWQNGEDAGTELCESPCVFEKDGLYYLVYSHGMGLKYAVSDSPVDFNQSLVYTLAAGCAPGKVPYNFELLDVETGLFGYLCGGYYSYAAFGFVTVKDKTITAHMGL